jgi:hypothetical protein
LAIARRFFIFSRRTKKIFIFGSLVLENVGGRCKNRHTNEIGTQNGKPKRTSASYQDCSQTRLVYCPKQKQPLQVDSP